MGGGEEAGTPDLETEVAALRRRRRTEGASGLRDGAEQSHREYVELLLTSEHLAPTDGLAVLNRLARLGIEGDDRDGDGKAFAPAALAGAPTNSNPAPIFAAGELARADDFPLLETVDPVDAVEIACAIDWDPDDPRVTDSALDMEAFAGEPWWNVSADDPELGVTRRIRLSDDLTPERGAIDVGVEMGEAVRGSLADDRVGIGAERLGEVEGAGPGIVSEALKWMEETRSVPVERVTGVDVLRALRGIDRRRDLNVEERNDLFEEFDLGESLPAELVGTRGVDIETGHRMVERILSGAVEETDAETLRSADRPAAADELPGLDAATAARAAAVLPDDIEGARRKLLAGPRRLIDSIEERRAPGGGPGAAGSLEQTE